MDGPVLEVSKPVKVTDSITGYVALFTLIGAVVLNSIVLFSNQYIGYKRLTDCLVLLTTSNLISAMVYSGIIVMTELKGQAMAGRYLQWFITVPLLFMAIIYYCDYLNTDGGSSQITFWKPLIVVILALGMVLFSCLGEFMPQYKLSFLLASLFMFIVTMAIFAAFYYTGKSAAFYWVTVVAFALYGVVHIFEAQYREFCFNILDTVTRVGFSVFIAFTLLGKPEKLPIVV